MVRGSLTGAVSAGQMACLGGLDAQASHELVRAGAPVSQLMGDCKADPCRGTQARSEACMVEGRP